MRFVKVFAGNCMKRSVQVDLPPVAAKGNASAHGSQHGVTLECSQVQRVLHQSLAAWTLVS